MVDNITINTTTLLSNLKLYYTEITTIETDGYLGPCLEQVQNVAGLN